MITGAVKNKVDQIWLHLYSGGITNPLTVIEQLTYLMFIRSLDKKEQENEKMANIFGEPVSHPIFRIRKSAALCAGIISKIRILRKCLISSADLCSLRLKP